MSENQTVWSILWEHAVGRADVREPFEVAEVVERVGEALHLGPEEADRLIRMLLDEVSRLPEERQHFSLVGDAVVPSRSFSAAPKDAGAAIRAYPFEL